MTEETDPNRGSKSKLYKKGSKIELKYKNLKLIAGCLKRYLSTTFKVEREAMQRQQLANIFSLLSVFKA